MINILKNIMNLLHDTILYTLDVSTLYNNIPQSMGIQAISELQAVQRAPNNCPLNSYVLDLFRVLLENNCFELNGEYYHEVAGSAIGFKFVPSYSKVFMSNLSGQICLLLPKSTPY